MLCKIFVATARKERPRQRSSESYIIGTFHGKHSNPICQGLPNMHAKTRRGLGIHTHL